MTTPNTFQPDPRTAAAYALNQLASLCGRDTLLYAAAECDSNAVAAGKCEQPHAAADYGLAAIKLREYAARYHPQD